MSEEEKEAAAGASATGNASDGAQTKSEPAPATTAPGQLVALIGEFRACRGAARALARQNAEVRILCADDGEGHLMREGLREGAGALDPDELARVSTVIGRLELDSDLDGILDGVSGVALLSPVELEGRTWRPATHLEDVRSVVEAVANRRIARVVYLSSVSANAKRPIRCLREAVTAEKLVAECGSTDFLLRTGPLVGRGDPWMTRVLKMASAACPLAVVQGYGDTPFQPIHEDDLGACIARCFLSPSGELRPGMYALASTPPAHMLNLLERAAEQLGRWPKPRLHVPLFLLSLGVRFRTLFKRDRAWEYADRLGLLRCGLVAEKNDLEALLGPACSSRSLTVALEEAAAARRLSQTA